MKRTSLKLSKRLDAHFVACTAAVGAAATLVPSHDAKAAIIFVNLSGSPIPIVNNIDGLYINFVTGANANATVAGWDFNPFATGGNLAFFASNTTGHVSALMATGGVIQALSFGAGIDGSQTFATGTQAATGTPFLTTQSTFYVGIRFFNEVTLQTDFGWALLSTSATTGFPATLIGYAYDNTGAGLTAGAIPEPGTYATLGLMALGAFGVRQWKRAGRAS